MRIEPRTSWGGPAEPIGHPTAGAKLLVVIHHSHVPHRACGATKAKERGDMLSMHRFHEGKGWGGVGYNFAVFQSGNVYEGRGWGRTGAHTVGRNSSSVGIVLVIDGENHRPTDAMVEAVNELIRDGIFRGYISGQHERAPHDRFQRKVCPGRQVKASGILGGFVPPVERAAAVAPMPALRKGSGGRNAPTDLREAVRELQRRLGMEDRHRTGYFGDVTDAAVRTFQRSRGLVEDGIVGPQTWRALN